MIHPTGRPRICNKIRAPAVVLLSEPLPLFSKSLEASLSCCCCAPSHFSQYHSVHRRISRYPFSSLDPMLLCWPFLLRRLVAELPLRPSWALPSSAINVALTRLRLGLCLSQLLVSDHLWLRLKFGFRSSLSEDVGFGSSRPAERLAGCEEWGGWLGFFLRLARAWFGV